ncbi:MAG: DMT family transporter [Candidatus Promineifilaceae bacterium]|jgi:drug/metabolite transporter (DMT)-like permease
MSSRSRAVIGLVFSVFLGSTSGVLIKLSSWDAMALNGARSFVAAVVVWAYLRHPNFTWSKAQVGGAVFFALQTITFVQATKWTTAANAVFLQFASPIWVALFSIWLLGERPSRREWMTIAVVGLGMLLFFSGELTQTGMWGNLIAILSGVCTALALIAMRAQKDGSPTETILLGNLIAGFVGLPFILLGDNTVDIREVGIILYFGIFQLGLTFIIISLAIKQLSAVETILIQTLAPILLSLWVFLIIGEKPSPPAMAGAAIITTAVTINAIGSARSKPAITPPM